MAATLRRRMPESNAVTCCWDRNGQTRRQRPGVMVVGDGWVVRRPCVRNKTTMTTELSMLDGPQRARGATGFRAAISDVASTWGVDWRVQFVSHTPRPGGLLRGGESEAFKAVNGVRAILGACGVSVRRPSCCGGQGS